MRLVIVGVLLVLQAVAGQDSCTEVKNCNSCDNPSAQCSDCPDKTVLSEDKKSCLDCSANCAECELDAEDATQTVCLDCDSKFYLDDGACVACTLTNCLECEMQAVDDADPKEVCTSCEAGYSLKSGECTGCALDKYLDGTSCKSCGSNVVKCKSDGSIDTCKDDGVKYVKNDDASSCVACPSDCVKCEYKDEAAKCTECPANLYVDDDGECAYCGGDDADTENCDVCGSEGVCEDCAKTYTVVSEECTSCESHCDECSEDEENGGTTCTDCSDNYGLNEGVVCGECPSKCTTCDISTGSCTACETGYGLAKKTASLTLCYALPTGCSGIVNEVVDGTPDCSACSNGYVDDTAGACVNCETFEGGSDHCTVCTYTAASGDDPAAVTCTTCADGYALDTDSDDTCVSCETYSGGYAGCSACTYASNAVSCYECAEAGTVAGDDACLNCATNDEGGVAGCNACTESSGVVSCTGCEDGYIFDTDTCYNCETFSGGVEKCNTCTYDAGAGRKKRSASVSCSACIDGYFLDTECYELPSNCDAAERSDDKSMCTTCSDGYAKKYSGDTATGTCSKCPTGCSTCTSDATGQQCTACEDKYILNTDECLACPDNCDVCSVEDDASVCTTCSDGFGLTDGACEECIANCNECDKNDDDELLCTECAEDYGLDEEQCAACPSSCLECSFSNGVMLCTKCEDEYVVNAGECQKCPSNCKECSTSKCNAGKCYTGYALNDAGVCTDCASLTTIENCATCLDKADKNSSAECTACDSGYILKDEITTADEGGECISTSELSCGAGKIVDKDAQCAVDGCAADTVLTDDFKCGRLCYVCGDVDTDVFVPLDNCKTDNETGVLAECLSGYCQVKSRRNVATDVVEVAGGCFPVDETCTDENSECEDTTEVEECEKCCSTNYCSNEGLQNGLSSSSRVQAAVNGLLLFACCCLLAFF